MSANEAVTAYRGTGFISKPGHPTLNITYDFTSHYDQDRNTRADGFAKSLEPAIDIATYAGQITLILQGGATWDCLLQPNGRIVMGGYPPPKLGTDGQG